MTTRTKTLIAAAAFAAIATSAFSQVPWEFNPGMAYMYAGPGKMMAMAMASTPKNHESMMKNATKVPNNTVFFMDNVGHARSDRQFLPAVIGIVT